MKKKMGILLVFLLNINYFCYVQAQEANSKRIDSLQVVYFTEKLVLTPEEGTEFWPVYNSYKNDIKVVRKDTASDQIAVEEKILNIRKKYKNDFKKILGTDDRVNKVYVLEKEFRDMLRNELLDRQNKDPDS
jgi:hypothetical protein